MPKNKKATTNNTENVSAIKGIRGGYIFTAPVGTPLPTDCWSKLDAAFSVLGFLSEDGYTETREGDSEELKDMNGDLMAEEQTSLVESAQFTPAEIKAETLKIMYGDDNVTDENGLITVKHNANSATTRSYALDLVLKNGRRCRRVVPNGQSSELDDLTMAASELGARAITIKYVPDEHGNTCYEYIESTETDRANV
ncbi:hypothetical protein KPC83_02920 [Collinsella sp. zg1085]|uniref:phage tail tube protein n=1 Tax=Collinsella sp. zg1085 TaxID=2844380 RepID=UPI001C0E48C0|nr:hypothetical protein [Collinsella sp. zg1085]QWT18097.1 hypothetical protein KPC83_02920 [Collinsella sp. zg1085]